VLERLEGLANRVHRIATGWEPQLTLAVDCIIVRSTLWQLCEQFFALRAPTRLRIRDETLTGTFNAVLEGHADLAIGTVDNMARANFQSRPLGEVPFIFAVAPQHALAKIKQAITNSELAQHRIVAVSVFCLGKRCLRCPVCKPSSTPSCVALAAAICHAA